MKKYIILFAAIIFSGISFAQKNDAVYKNIKKEYTMQKDGNIEFRCQKELELNSLYSFNRMFGETFITYNPDFQKLIIHESYTIKANGEKVETPKNAFNEILPHAVANYPAYNQMREMVITHTALEIGATIYLDYSIISKPPFLKEMLGQEILAERVPVENYEITLKVPARRSLNFTLLNSKTKPKENNDGSYRSYRWTFHDLIAQAYEQAAPPAYETAPTLVFSTSANFESELINISKKEGFQGATLMEPKKMIEDAQKSTFSEKELALSIQKYIANNIDSKQIPLYWNNYQLQSPSQVWNANVGSQVEKTVLLWRTLLMAGLHVKMVGFYPQSLWKSSTKIIDDFSAYGVQIELKGGESLVLSANKLNNKTLELDYPNHLMIDMHTGKTLNPISMLSHPSIHINGELTIDPGNQISGQLNLKLEAGLLDNISIAQDTQRIKNYFSSILPYSESKPITAKFANPLSAKFQIPIKGEAKLRTLENYSFWTIPHLTNGIAAHYFNRLASLRDFPIIVPALEEEYSYSITIPKSIEWVGKETHIAYQTNFGEMHIDIALKNGKIQVDKYLKIEPQILHIPVTDSRMAVESIDYLQNNRMLSLEEYAEFRKMMIDWNNHHYNELVFKK